MQEVSQSVVRPRHPTIYSSTHRPAINQYSTELLTRTWTPSAEGDCKSHLVNLSSCCILSTLGTPLVGIRPSCS